MGNDDTIWKPIEHKGRVVGGDNILELIMQGLVKDAQRKTNPPKPTPQILEPIPEEKPIIPILEDQTGMPIFIDKETIQYEITSPGAEIDSTYRPINPALDAAKDSVLKSFEANAAMINHPLMLDSALSLMTYIDITRNGRTIIGTIAEVIFGNYALGTVANIPQDDFLFIGLFTHPTEKNAAVYQALRSDTEEIIAAGYVHKQKGRYRVEPTLPFQTNRFNLMI